MKLKPSKCFIVVGVVKLTQEIVLAIRGWLARNIPEWKDFQIVSVAKYLGVFIGRGGAIATFAAPVNKFLDRVEEVAGTSAPALGSILRYNERVATVLSYVSQFVAYPDQPGLAALEQRAVHKILKFPPNTISRRLMHSLEPFLAVSPVAVVAQCSATLCRFASAEADALIALRDEALELIGNSLPVALLNCNRIPDAGLSCSPYLNEMLDVIDRVGKYSALPAGARTQKQFYEALVAEVKVASHAELNDKICRALCSDQGLQFCIPPAWHLAIPGVLSRVKQHSAFSLFRTLVGAWTTSHRMHEATRLPCIFGCSGERDDLSHYLFCSPLWQIAGAALGTEVPLDIPTRICIHSVSVEHVQLVALVSTVYHYTKTRVRELGGFAVVGQRATQQIATEACRTFAGHVT